MNEFNKILAVSIGGLGDTILFSPFLKALRRTYPGAHIELLVANRLAKEAYSFAKEVSNVTFANFNRSSTLLKATSLIPLIINAQLTGRFDIGFYATGLNRKLGELMKTVGVVREIACAPSVPICSTDFGCNLMFARSIDNKISEDDVFIPVTKNAELEARNILRDYNLASKNEKLLAIYPSVELLHRPRWELAKLIQVIKMIRNNGFNGKVVVVGSKIEGKEWDLNDIDKTVDANLAGKLSILGTAALLKKCFFAIGNDGGLMHVAGAIGCPTVVIMPNTPLSYRPPGQHVKVIHSSVTCCLGIFPNRPKGCKEAKYTNDISIEEVYRSCESLISDLNLKTNV